MKCPKCNCEAIEVPIPLFPDSACFGALCTGVDPFSLVKTAANKTKAALQDKKLYVCTNKKCGYEFEK